LCMVLKREKGRCVKYVYLIFSAFIRQEPKKA
jgi:hypothetical protein